MTLFLTPYSLLEPFFSLLSKKAYDPTEHGTYTYSLELPISATTLQALWAAASTQFTPAAAIPAHSTIQCPPCGTHHIQAPSPLAQASVGVFSPCGKNKQENCRFLWDLQPRRPGKRARSHHPALNRAQPARAHARAQQPPSPLPIHPPLP